MRSVSIDSRRVVCKNNSMLTKKDLEMIDEIMQKRIGQDVPKFINAAFEDFYDHIFEPFATQNQQQHQELVREIKKLQKREEEHDKRIKDLEKTAKFKN